MDGSGSEIERYGRNEEKLLLSNDLFAKTQATTTETVVYENRRRRRMRWVGFCRSCLFVFYSDCVSGKIDLSQFIAGVQRED